MNLLSNKTAAFLFTTIASLPCWAAVGAVSIVAKNPLDIPGRASTLAISWQQIRQADSALKPEEVQVFDPATGAALASQEVDLDGDGTSDEIVFQADFAAGETKNFGIRSGQPATTSAKVFGRLVPERKDDFAWENDRIGFRMYGRRLEDELVSSGVDVWCKRTRSLVIDRWYKLNNYHTDHGEGLDCYKVGAACGCGGTAIFRDGRLHASRNFAKSRVIASGPIRFMFELTYEPWDAGGIKVAETKRITLDAGQDLNRFECDFTSDPPAAELPVAIGLQEHGTFQTVIHADQGWMRVWEPTDDKLAGKLGVGLVISPSLGAEMKEAVGHALTVVHAENGKPVVFFAGAGWEKSGEFLTVKSWDDSLSQFAKRVRSPLQVTISKE
jgi:hypothetical protein